jgi:hypothetical protein
MNCCRQKLPGSRDVEEALLADPDNAPTAEDDSKHCCPSCGGIGRPVKRKTVLLMLKADRLDRVGGGTYRFCSDPECRVVYFAEGRGERFVTDDLRTRVGIKEKTDPIPLCYCFGFDEADIRKEIAAIGRATIPQRIVSLLKEGMCSCPSRDPSGACCIREVASAVRRLYASALRSADEVTG